MRLTGRAWCFGDHIDTDQLAPSRYHDKRLSLEEYARHCLEDVRPEFAQQVKPGDFVVAGINFGCGSSRETAPGGLKASGVRCIIARSFARIFFRNAVNIGLLPIVAPEAVDGIGDGDPIVFDVDTGIITNQRTGQQFRCHPVPKFLQNIIAHGGLMAARKAEREG